MTSNGHQQQNTGMSDPVVDTFRLVAENRRQLELVNQRAGSVIKQFYRSPEDLCAFIERKGTPVYKLNSKIAWFFISKILGYQPGFIPADTGKRFQLLTRYLGQMQSKANENNTNLSLEHGVFLVNEAMFTVGFLTHQLHHWLACRSGMAGYDNQTQELYQAFWSEHQGQISSKLLELPPEELKALREAINRDLEALKFLKQIVNEVLDPAHQGKQIKASAQNKI